MAGQGVMLPLLLICFTHVTIIIGAQNRIRVVNVPPNIDEAQFERRVSHIPESFEEYVQKIREIHNADDTSTESTTLETASNSIALDDIELAKSFLDAEKKYANLLEDVESDDTSTSEDTRLNEIEDVQFTEIPLDSTLAKNFLESERYHTHSEEGGSSNLNVCGTVNLNKIVDELLDGVRQDMVKRGLDTIKIPNIYEKFVKKAGFIKVTGYFQAEQGWAKNLSTIHRTADAIASSQGTSLSVSCGFGLSHLEFGYDKYKAKFLKIGPSGKLDVTISQNSLLLNATVSWNNNTCKATLDYLSLNELGGFNLKITGLGPLNWLLKKISDWVFKKFHGEIREKIEATLKEEIEKQLKTLDCTQYLLSWYKYK